MALQHWMTTGLLGATGTFQRAAREYAEEYAAMAVAAERERIAKHFDERDHGRDGTSLGIGFYDPHEPAEIIRALAPNRI